MACFFYLIVYQSKNMVADFDESISLQWYPPLDFLNYVDSRFLEEDYGIFL